MSNETRKAEARSDDTAPVTFRGETFTISTAYDEFPVEFVESLEEGKTVGICRGALGPAQWRRVRAMNLKMKDLAELSDLIATAMGFGDAGESAASSD